MTDWSLFWIPSWASIECVGSYTYIKKKYDFWSTFKSNFSHLLTNNCILINYWRSFILKICLFDMPFLIHYLALLFENRDFKLWIFFSELTGSGFLRNIVVLWTLAENFKNVLVWRVRESNNIVTCLSMHPKSVEVELALCTFFLP